MSQQIMKFLFFKVTFKNTLFEYFIILIEKYEHEDDHLN